MYKKNILMSIILISVFLCACGNSNDNDENTAAYEKGFDAGIKAVLEDPTDDDIRDMGGYTEDDLDEAIDEAMYEGIDYGYRESRAEVAAILSENQCYDSLNILREKFEDNQLFGDYIADKEKKVVHSTTCTEMSNIDIKNMIIDVDITYGWWIFRCGGAASPAWREPPVRTNGATFLLYL